MLVELIIVINVPTRKEYDYDHILQLTSITIFHEAGNGRRVGTVWGVDVIAHTGLWALRRKERSTWCEGQRQLPFTVLNNPYCITELSKLGTKGYLHAIP